ncbi:VOC family protein [Mycolicibacterium sediminis]|uniref:VOC family protein n=1 Tax=Mycolicibacterium sediminis TaxID=1286180 RepID=UPI0013D2C103|nr:VOC family protein [Mycolicibacterium sediminis]
MTVNLELLSPTVEIGLVTTNLDAMVDFYEGFLGLELQGEIEFAEGSQRRYVLGASVLKLVSYHTPPAAPPVPGGGKAQAGLRYFTIGVTGLAAAAQKVEAAGYQIVEPPTEFAPVPGMGWMFIADPDGNSIELFGTL